MVTNQSEKAMVFDDEKRGGDTFEEEKKIGDGAREGTRGG